MNPSSKRHQSRVAVVLPYWTFWESSVPRDLRAEKETLLARVANALAFGANVVAHDVVASREEAASLADLARERGAEALVVLQTMAVPPAYLGAAVARLIGLPIILWALTSRERLTTAYGEAEITTEGATVGIPMITNVLVRQDRPFYLIMGRADDAAVLGQVLDAITAASAASRIRRARVGLVGRAPDGYDCVIANADDLHAQLGVTVVQIEPAEVRELYGIVPDKRVREVMRETEAMFEIDEDAAGEPIERSLRLACAIEDLVDRHRLNAGAMNCHVPEIRFSEEIGVTPCFGLGRMTSRGVPWTCAGDVVTVMAMLCLKSLNAAALYHELEALDATTGEFVIANTGEHDLAFSSGGRPRISKNSWFVKDTHCGICARVSPTPGLGTLAAFTELDRPEGRTYRLIAARGEFTDRAWPQIGTPSASFRFLNGGPTECWGNWCRAGANHHSAATQGDYIDSLKLLGRFLGLQVIVV